MTDMAAMTATKSLILAIQSSLMTSSLAFLFYKLSLYLLPSVCIDSLYLYTLNVQAKILSPMVLVKDLSPIKQLLKEETFYGIVVECTYYRVALNSVLKPSIGLYSADSREK
uniref:Uncharacterized protein n=1 Tax=Glossina pallidipes TaxID=7398 RepID=A0A1A9ZQ50_GLOPL